VFGRGAPVVPRERNRGGMINLRKDQIIRQQNATVFQGRSLNKY
jgi:hypothetical protein